MALRITTRLIIAWTLSGLVVFGGYGIFLVRAERADLRGAVEREVWLLGSSVQVAIQNAIRDGQLDDMDETALILEGIDRTVDVFVHRTDQSLMLTTGRPQGAYPDWLDRVDDAPRLHWVTEEGESRLLLVARLEKEDPALAPYGTLVLSRALQDVEHDLARTRRSAAATVGIFVLTSALLGWLLGTRYIGHPLASLTRAMQRVRGGDLEPRLNLYRDDEVGALADEFDLMMAELREARQRLKDEGDALQSMQRALQQADKLITLGQLAATVAHEIGSPLQVLHGRARALRRHADQPDTIRRHADILVRETERVAGIVEQLLSTTRQHAPSRVQVDLALQARQAVDLLDLVARRKRVSLHLEGDTEAFVEGDPGGLQQVVINLLSNALAASQDGGRVVIAVRALPDASAVQLLVSDSGCGMSPEVEARIFEPFFSTRAEGGGTGLGLVVVQRIVTEHDGRITVETAEGAGTTVTVTLPTPIKESPGERPPAHRG